MNGIYKHYKGELYKVLGEGTYVNERKKEEIFLTKEKEYKWISLAIHTEKDIDVSVHKDKKGNMFVCSKEDVKEDEKVVIYQNKEGVLWVRPYDMFNEDVLVEGKKVKRFLKVD